MTTSTTKSINTFLTTAERDVLQQFDVKLNSIYSRGGLSALKSRQVFLNSTTEHIQLRLQHIQMLHKDADVLSTKGSILYYVKTIKTTNVKKLNSNSTITKKLFFVKTVATENSTLAIRDYHITDKSNVEFSGIRDRVNFDMPSLPELQLGIDELLKSKTITKAQALFSLDYFCFLSKCLGKQPRFSLTTEECDLVNHSISAKFIQDTFDLTWILIQPDFKKSTSTESATASV